MVTFDSDYSVWGEIIGDPVSHVFMTATVDLLARSRQTTPLRVLEIGSWVGGSAATWSEALSRFHPPAGSIVCVDPWTAYPVENDVHGGAFAERYQQALASGEAFQRFLGNTAKLPHQVIPIRGFSRDVLPFLRDASFDIVYVDGDHAYDACRYDIEQAKRLVADGGIVCGDDLDLTIEQVDRQFLVSNRNKQPAVDPATDRQFHPGVTLAVAEAFAAKSHFGFWGAIREAQRFVPIDFTGVRAFVPRRFGPELRATALKTLKGFVSG